MTDGVAPTTGDLVRGALAVAKIPQRRAAAAIGIGQPQLSQRINGRIPFRVYELTKIAELCRVPVASLISDRQVAA